MNKFFFAITILFVLGAHACAQGQYTTPNFSVVAPSQQWAQAIGDAAEQYRVELAKLWLNEQLPQWSQPCAVRANIEKYGYGSTNFAFVGGEVFGWDMSLHGPAERLIDSVLKHEVNHTIFASHFRQPLPRWADEGACTTVEHPAEKAKPESALINCLKAGRGIPFSSMLQMMNYPSDFETLYSQGYSVAEWLIEQYGNRKFIEFLDDGLKDKNWPRAVKVCYGYNSPLDMQNDWNGWVRAGRPDVKQYMAAKHCLIDQYGRRYCVPDPWDYQQQPPQTGNPSTYVNNPPVTSPPPSNPPPATNPPSQPPTAGRSCDCLPKWDAFAKWQTEINAKLEAQLKINSDNSAHLTKVDTALSSLTQSTSNVTNIDQRVTKLEHEPIPTIDEILTELDKRRKPPRIRIVDPQGKFTTDFKTLSDNTDTDLLIDQRFTSSAPSTSK